MRQKKGANASQLFPELGDLIIQALIFRGKVVYLGF